jgi:hypothetical protein
VNNNHLYPILNTETKKSVAHTGLLNIGSAYEFNINYDNIQYIEDLSREIINESAKVILLEAEQNNEVLKKAMLLVQQQTKTNIDYMKFNNGKLIAFQNPKTKQIYEETIDYKRRIKIIEYLQQQVGQSLITFKNQSYTQIGNFIFDNYYGQTNYIKSNLSNKVFDILDTYHFSAYIEKYIKDNEDHTKADDCYGVDVVKSYSSVLLNNQDNYPIFQAFDEPKIFKS